MKRVEKESQKSEKGGNGNIGNIGNNIESKGDGFKVPDSLIKKNNIGVNMNNNLKINISKKQLQKNLKHPHRPNLTFVYIFTTLF